MKTLKNKNHQNGNKPSNHQNMNKCITQNLRNLPKNKEKITKRECKVEFIEVIMQFIFIHQFINAKNRKVFYLKVKIVLSIN